MRWLRFVTVAALLPAFACGGTEGLEAACQSDCPANSVTLCGTDDSVGFIVIDGLAPGQESGTPLGFAQRGIDVLFEIGSQYVGISPSCEYWHYSPVGPDGTPGGTVLTGRLDEEQAARATDLLKLEHWEVLGPVHGRGGAFDVPPTSFHWGTRTTAWITTPDLVGPPPLPEGFPSDPPTLALSVIRLLSELGQPVDGPVRYTVLFAPEAPERRFTQAPTWPLETPITAVASTEDQIVALQADGLPPPVHRAEGLEAARLRSLRSAARNGEFGDLESPNFIPIREPDGSKYLLFARDVGSFESPEGVPTRDPLSL